MRLEISCFIENGELSLSLNGETIILGSGRLKKDIQTGKSYRIDWLVKGMQGTSYSISISSPQLAEFHLSKVIGLKGVDAGMHKFET